MSQATEIGLCSSNLVTLLQPSSTIERVAGIRNSGLNSSFSTLVSGPTAFTATTVVSLSGSGNPTLVEGSVSVADGSSCSLGSVPLSGAFAVILAGSTAILYVAGSGVSGSYSVYSS